MELLIIPVAIVFIAMFIHAVNDVSKVRLRSLWPIQIQRFLNSVRKVFLKENWMKRIIIG
ncbi:hypothetical protein DYI25_04850 [Mesobacillus boroniphilus]|uniref:Uncharacterized protein n=1 Tax=Mesobacillus boroniphilus TaxID=308892 RepID=A0A944CIC6_9BACI|nr:hypothetical protein [Mesobacillus boroniphilus]MBS8263771.1 hypothetical protein [Mesobacillus boroniphilus]